MKKLAVLLITGLLILSFAACSAGPNASPTVAPSNSASAAPTDSNKPAEQIKYVGDTYVQYPDVRDYTYSWWPESTGTEDKHKFFIQTGNYGISVNGSNGMINKIGAIAEEYTQTTAGTQDASVINALPNVKISASAVVSGKNYTFNNNIDSGKYNYTNIRIIESGQYMQSFDVGGMKFEDQAKKEANVFTGRTEIKATPQYFAINYQLFARNNITKATLSYSLTFDKEMTATLSQNGKEGILKGADGAGFAITVSDEKASLAYDASTKTLTLTCTDVTVKRNEFGGFGAIIIPSTSPSQADIDNYKAISGIKFSTYQIEPREGKAIPVEFDADRGVWAVDNNLMTTASGNAFGSDRFANAADRMTVTLENPSEITVKVPIMFFKDNNFAVEGFGAILRDATTGEPLGVPVQISKNWHNYSGGVTDADWFKYLSGKWYHGYTYIEVPAKSTVTYEYMTAYNNWGTVHLANHAQLCLIGWITPSTHQIWHTSTIGSSSEGFCFDPDQTCGLAFINDVRGVGFDPFDNGAKYNWGANNGGGNMLYYGKDGTDTTGMMWFKNMRVFYRNYSPNLTEIIFTGITQDDAVEVKFTSYMGRTNDVSRATHTFEYKFLKDVTFERMAFYQIGADNHNSGRWHGITIGNNDGPIEYTIAGETYGAEAEIPVYEEAGYIGKAGMQRIEVPGEGMWIAFTDSYEGVNSDYFPSKNGNRMLNLLYFEAELNGKSYTKPAFNLRSTEMFCGDSTLVELCPPAEVGNTVKAGSTVKGGVEYINLPISLSSIYFESEILKSFPAEEFDTWKLAHRYAMGGKLKAEAKTGTVVRNYPIAVRCAKAADVLAEVTVTGGISYIPLTFTNVPLYSGYRLEKLVNGQWEKVDQSYRGNDYWQTYYDAEAGTYELTFNVEHSGDPNAQYSYRLVKA